MANLHDYPDYVSIRASSVRPSPGLWLIRATRMFFYITGYFGVSKSFDGGQTFTGYNFQGVETTCIESVVCDPQTTGKVYATIGDHSVAASADGGATFKPLGKTSNRTVSICFSRARPGLLLAGVGRKEPINEDRAFIWRSTDGGATGAPVRTFFGQQAG